MTTVADSKVTRLVELALMEDIGLGDLTSDAIVDDAARSEAEFICKEQGIIAGLEVAFLALRICDNSCSCTALTKEGDEVRPGEVIASVEGSTRSLLKAERTALNFLQRMSGIATLTSCFVKAVEGTRAKITDTRKTAPGLRIIDKWAVRLGGGVNHRFGLDDMVLIKDNHVIAAGGVRQAIELSTRFVSAHGIQVGIEVEARNIAEVKEALACRGVQRIMLDNFSVGMMKTAVELIDGHFEIEASGGITLETVRAVAETGVDFISVGSLTHSAKALDISLELSPSRLPAGT